MNSNIWGQSYVNMGAWKEIRERTVKGRQVMGALERVMKGRSVKYYSKKGNKEQCYSPDTVICLRDMDMECSTAVTNKRNGNELHAGCMWCVKVG